VVPSSAPDIEGSVELTRHTITAATIDSRAGILAIVAGIAALLGGCTERPGVAPGRIIVSGASGQLGGLVVDDLLELGVAPQDLILVSRTPEKLDHYALLGASTRFGDFMQPDSLPAAYAGGDRMLLISVNGGAGDRPRLHENAIAAAVAAGVKQIVYTSFVNADRNTASALASDHRKTEQALENSGIAWTMLRNQIYMNGIVDQAVDAIRVGELVTHRPDARVGYVTREDCAAAAAAVLAYGGHEGRAYNVTGPELVGPREIASLASEISGHDVELVALTEEQYADYLRRTGMPEAAIRGSLSFAAEQDSVYLREVTTAVADLTGRPPTSVRELLEANRSRLTAAAR
jgi:NAD(P)H dehydrogenase (quinone)